MNHNKHKQIMYRLLLDIFQSEELSNVLAFKGGTSLMFFHNLPRFSVDLDFNILDITQTQAIYERVRNIVLQYGKIKDEQVKYFGPIIVVDYEKGERNLKLEFSTRFYDNHYELNYLSGVGITTMVKPDMFAHKLCALLDREGVTGRDVFDIHFFLQKSEAIHREIVEQRMGKPLEEYVGDCIQVLQSISVKELMANVGDLLNEADKQKMRSGKLLRETIEGLEAFRLFPNVARYPENDMPITFVNVVKNKQGDSLLAATIEGKYYMSRVLELHEKAQINAYTESRDKENFLMSLARSSYYLEYTQEKESKSKKRGLLIALSEEWK